MSTFPVLVSDYSCRLFSYPSINRVVELILHLTLLYFRSSHWGQARGYAKHWPHSVRKARPMVAQVLLADAVGVGQEAPASIRVRARSTERVDFERRIASAASPGHEVLIEVIWS